ncbi:hypothetical protein PACTADRAFT_51211 [Pachysolen tannophilus NRRL Y-2460]|uniref:Cytokinin riboside 5'-monophosphate phosphoribohydrolase n=1 Tax=Pachysolen tannophilus NRRL Y-2460 TaxID=669874 RepID=A0A1E4TRR0_PACTA|nr:hypothetical protein PACTADRAFT_51211 [Pachysolen tannophilus NRRL Y-2460]
MSTPDPPDKRVCVFCGSSFGTKQIFQDATSELGAKLAEKGYGIVYGGGTTGLMGVLAKSAVSNNGYVHGIIPDALISRERAPSEEEEVNEKLKQSVENHNGTTPVPDETKYGTTTIVSDMHSRKRMMGKEANCGFIALPGGYGTFEELLEVTTWNQLGIHQKPIIIFNIDGFYDGFVKFIQNSIENGFISKSNGSIIVVANTVDEVIFGIENYVVADGRFGLNWTNQ